MIDLDALRRLEGAATPGPWECEQDWTWELYGPNKKLIGQIINAAKPFGCTDDARLIPAMRNALPSLLALLEEAREFVEWYANYYRDSLSEDPRYLKARAFLSKFDTKREG